MIDNPDEITVIADLPGCDAEDIRVQATDDQLSIAAERLEEKEVEQGNPLQRERAQAAERTVQLPASVDVDDAEATCENGVCQVVLPKHEEDRQREIGFQ